MILAYIIIFFASVSLALLLLLPLIGSGVATALWWRGLRAWAILSMLGCTGAWVLALGTAVAQKRSYCTQVLPRLLTAENLAHHEAYYGEKFSLIKIHPELCSEAACAELSSLLQRPVQRTVVTDFESQGTASALPTVHDAAGDMSYLDVVNVGADATNRELVVLNSRVTGGLVAWVDSAMWLHGIPGLLWLRDCVAQP